MKFNLRTPCKNCPFRSDIDPYLTVQRASEIANCNGVFACHKTTQHEDETDETYIDQSTSACAGFLIHRELRKDISQGMRIAERLRLYNPRNLQMKNTTVYSTLLHMMRAYRKANV